ncbi:MAG: IMP cyclohydrolase [Clostridia bacterium]|nr:IMP cyclohydrolase [Clostridia bacterium]MBQ5802367.1 IMP cyclohydrolase [Clostridia bacterium]
MSVYKVDQLPELLKTNTYPGRGIVVGLTEDGENAFFAYFIMGRSENSRNRIFSKTEDGIIIYPFDESKVEDPSLIIYSPVRKINNTLIVTNGDQTDTVYDFMANGKSFEEALNTRAFEPDAPNFTPRISAAMDFNGGYTYKMNICKSADAEGSACNRYNWAYVPTKGVGHFLHTYNGDGNPIPTFTGEPERVFVPNNLEAFAEEIWNNLNANNKISLYVGQINLKTGEEKTVMYNKNKA